MFSYRNDKVGFFAGLVLLCIVLATVIATFVLLLLGDWDAYGPWVKFVLGLSWVLIIATVLTRVYIFGWQQKRERRKKLAGQETNTQESAAVNQPGPQETNEQSNGADASELPTNPVQRSEP